jgi:8-oxo-dGTP pyrophosphatase MutT (NUDIX family)
MKDEGPRGLAASLRAELARPLPGREYQERMLPAARRSEARPPSTSNSAVLLALLGARDEASVVLIERSAGGPHGGQYAFPGGKEEAGADGPVATALREAREEIGLDPREVEVLGLLSPLVVAVSAFRVQPVVGFVSLPPSLLANRDEVAAILEVRLEQLTRPESKAEREILVRGERLLVPCYLFGEALVWGATAMMLREFEEVLRRSGASARAQPPRLPR